MSVEIDIRGLTLVQNVRDGHNLAVVRNEIVESNRSLKAEVSRRERENSRVGLSSFQQITARHRIGETRPRTTRRVNLVRLRVVIVLKVLDVVTDEVRHQGIAVRLRPGKPIVHRRLNIENRVAVQLGGIHLPHLIGSRARVSATVDRCENQRIRMERVTGELAGVAKLEDALANLEGCTVHLIEEQHHTVVARSREPIGRTKGRYTLIHSRQTEKVAFGHLRSTTLDNRHSEGFGILINHGGLTDAVATTEKDRMPRVSNEGKDGQKILEVDCHVFFLFFSSQLSTIALSTVYILPHQGLEVKP